MDQDRIINEFGQSVTSQGQSLIDNQLVVMLLTFAVVVVLLIIAVYVIRLFLLRHFRKIFSFRRTIFQVLMPKEPEAQASKEEAIQKKDIKEVIAEAEGLYAALVGIGHPRTWDYFWYRVKKFWTGKHNHLTLEIIAHEGKIVFYVITPKNLSQYVEKQIHAIYNTAQIEEVADYNIFEPMGFVTGAYLVPTRGATLPLKTYKKMDIDPLEVVANNLSKLEPDEGVVIQLAIRPAKEKWRSRGMAVAREMHKGKTLEQALKGKNGWLSVLALVGNFPLKALQFIFESFSGNKKSSDQSKPKSEADELRQAPTRILKREEELIQALEEKYSKPYFEANLRLVVSAKTKARTKILLRSAISSFSQFTAQNINNSLKERLVWFKRIFINDFIYRNFRERKKFIASSEELTSMFHFPLPFDETPNIVWLTSRRVPPPIDLPATGVILGKSLYRGEDRFIRLQADDRRRHLYIVGKSGVGKSVMLANMAVQDVLDGRGLCIIDPHGDLVDDILERIPKERADDVIVFDPADMERPLGLNLLEFDPRYPEQKTFVINEMIKIFDKLYDLKATGGPMFEQYMRNAMLLVMEDPESGSTLMEISKVLSDPEYRKYKLTKCKTAVVKDFWVKEAEKAGGEAALANMVPYITSKLSTFISNDFMRPIIGQQTSAINFRDVMDSGKILLVRLSKGRLGDINTNLLGMMIVGKILMAALSRTDVPKEERRDFYLYIDEFQNFTTDSIAVILSEARKYMLNLIVAHQYIGQLVHNNDTTIRDAVFGNVGTMAVFKIGAEDAEFLAKEFAPAVNQFDLVNVEKYTAYIKLLVNNQTTRPFNMQTIMLPPGNRELGKKIFELSRLKFGKSREIVEREIIERSKTIDYRLEKR